MTVPFLHVRLSRKAAAELIGVSVQRVSQLAAELGRERDPVTELVTFDSRKVAEYAAARRAGKVQRRRSRRS